VRSIYVGFVRERKTINTPTHCVKVKVKQSHYRPDVPRLLQEVNVPRLHDNGPGWW